LRQRRDFSTIARMNAATFLLTSLSALLLLAGQMTVAADSGVILQQSEAELRVTWPLGNGESGTVIFNLDETKPLIESLAISRAAEAPVTIARALNPVTLLTVGSRDAKNPQGWGAFFDNTPRRPYETYVVTLGKRRVQATNDGARTIISIAEAKGGTFHGDVRFTFYRNSPLLHVETVLTTQEDWRAIIYDAGLTSAKPDWEAMAWKDTAGEFQSAALDAEARAKSVAVSGRTIVAQGRAGSLATFPPPHQFFYPQDEAYNLEFVWHGKDFRGHVSEHGFGVRQSATGDNRFVPWFNAPPGTAQRLGVFYLLTRGNALRATAPAAHGSATD
jgi:hypothetical protein